MKRNQFLAMLAAVPFVTVAAKKREGYTYAKHKETLEVFSPNREHQTCPDFGEVFKTLRYPRRAGMDLDFSDERIRKAFYCPDFNPFDIKKGA